MSKIISYGVITHPDAEALCEAVNLAIQNGVEPHGGVTWAAGAFIQSMVKIDRSDEEQLFEQINHIHTAAVVDLADFIQNWRDHQSYPRAVTVQK